MSRNVSSVFRYGLWSLGVVAVLAAGVFVLLGTDFLRAGEEAPSEEPAPAVAQNPKTVEEPPAEEREDAGKEAREQEEGQEREDAAEQNATADNANAEQQAPKEQEALEEQAVAESEEEAPDTVAAPAAGMLSLTVPKMGLYDNVVANDISLATLDQGAGKLPSSGFPWEPGANTYIAAHVLGFEGTGSWLQFANLPNMAVGDEIFLTDSDGTTYTYVVSEVMTVSPYDTWVMDPVPGRQMVSLQTCVGSNYEWRLIVRADQVA